MFSPINLLRVHTQIVTAFIRDFYVACTCVCGGSRFTERLSDQENDSVFVIDTSPGGDVHTSQQPHLSCPLWFKLHGIIDR